MPLTLKEVEPIEDVMKNQGNVQAYWEKDCLGQGSLFFTEKYMSYKLKLNCYVYRKVIWLNESTRKGIVLYYPAICIHATSSGNEDFPDPCLFLVIDVNKTDIDYTPEQEDVDDDSSDSTRTVTIRFVPTESSTIGELYSLMNSCQELNPDPEDEQISGHWAVMLTYRILFLEGTCEEELVGENGQQLDTETDDHHNWFTTDTGFE
jgi:hypothetical protein